ncbi:MULTISPECIES: hypothetical protein [Mycobacterium avium complex (MAC)]|uniref:hypothetical protein n=1 Tax=Mycobacterium avium complex (MAC) TaxID=120793 RepID=UPI001FC9AFB2|nr:MULTISPECIES: hypothetical protein [Mycobacterium avium complex (MAC)]
MTANAVVKVAPAVAMVAEATGNRSVQVSGSVSEATLGWVAHHRWADAAMVMVVEMASARVVLVRKAARMPWWLVM